MQKNKELEFLREYFVLDLEQYDEEDFIFGGSSKQLELRRKILEIQKQRDVEAKIERFETFCNTYQLTQFEDLLEWIK